MLFRFVCIEGGLQTAPSLPFFFILWVRQKHYFISSWCDRHSCSCIFFNLLHSDYVCLKPWHCKWWLQGKVHVSPGRQPNTELMLTLFHPGIRRACYKHTDWYQHLVGTDPRGFVMKKKYKKKKKKKKNKSKRSCIMFWLQVAKLDRIQRSATEMIKGL